MTLHKRTRDFDHADDDRPFAARVVDLEAFAAHPLTLWRECVVEGAYKLGLLVGAGYSDQFSADRVWRAAISRRGGMHFDVQDMTAMQADCAVQFERGQAEGKRSPKAVQFAFPQPDAGLFQTSRSVPRISAATLTGPFYDLVAQETANTGLPTNYLVLAWITACAGVIGTVRAVSPMPFTYSEPAILWTALVGEPSDKKSPSIDRAHKLVTEIDAELHPENERRQKNYAREKLRYQAEVKAFETAHRDADRAKRPSPTPPDEPDKPVFERLLVSNVTPEKLIALFADNPRGLVGIFDELPAFWKSFNTYAQGDGRQLALKAYGARSGQLDRVKMSEPLIAERCALSVLGGVQTDVLRKVIEGSEDDGFFARFIYVLPSVHPQKLQGSTLPLDPVRLALQRLRALDFDASGEPIVLYLEESCRDEFSAWRTKTENNSRYQGPGMKGWMAKGPGMVLRIALVLELMRWAGRPSADEPEHVSQWAFENARSLWEDALVDQAAAVFGQERSTPADEDARRLAIYLAESGERTVNASTIREGRRVKGLTRSENVKAAFHRLADASIVFPNRQRDGGTEAGRGSTGRARLDYIVNPALAEMIRRIGNPEAA
ncbi:DUF3987 domain-containing protein [Aureimonas psammosilenae]|uniref:DUF3987 domain-containing protein n=1 Tax=Aureimonas psammosilenae TaxID=2495496 RepID=UPI001260DC5C|nr:DUF3987 domain-containing protein [Aureimonas psammosilenae]